MKPLTYSFAATESDIQAAFAARLEVFVREQEVPVEEELDEFDRVARHLVVKEGEKVIATARIYFASAAEARIGRMAILAPYRRQGIGTRILALLCKEAKRQQATRATLHAQWYARPFYARSGFVEMGEPFWEAGIKHVTMEKRL